MDNDPYEKPPGPIEPGTVPTPRQVGGFPHGISRHTWDCIVTFLVWIAGAELTFMAVGTLLLRNEPVRLGWPILMNRFAVTGAVIGLLPACLVTAVVATRGSRPPVWAITFMSLFTTLATVGGFWLLVH